eukprot:833442-Pelagomonas_calceolata.AAC.1
MLAMIKIDSVRASVPPCMMVAARVTIVYHAAAISQAFALPGSVTSTLAINHPRLCLACSKWSSLTVKRALKSSVTHFKEKEKRKGYACQVWPHASRKGHLKGRAALYTPRGRGGTEVYTSKFTSKLSLLKLTGIPQAARLLPLAQVQGVIEGKNVSAGHRGGLQKLTAAGLQLHCNALAQCERDHRRALQASSSAAAPPADVGSREALPGMEEAEEDPFIARLRSNASVARLLDEVRVLAST